MRLGKTFAMTTKHLIFVLMMGLLGGCSGVETVEPEGESRFLANVRQLTDNGKNGEGYFTPDGRSIIFQSIRGEHPFYQIFTKQLPDGQEKMVSTGHGRTTCSYFHPNGKKILYASSHLDPNREEEVVKELKRLAEQLRSGRRSYLWFFDPQMEIFEANLDGSNLKRLTNASGYDAEGSYSADASRIVFCSFRNGNGDIYTMNADGTDVKQITNSPGYDGGPFFSPDAKRIIFRGEARKRKYLQIFVINADGTGEKQLTDDGFLNWGPYWHPSGKYVIYSTSAHGHRNYELYLLDLESGKKTRVTHTAGADVLPVFSPDGKKLMWTTTRGKDSKGKNISQLFIADWVWDHN